MTSTDPWAAWGRGTWGTNATSGGLSTHAYTLPMTTDPFLSGTGPAECSSSTALSVVPAFIFDVNGYYRELGVPTNATRAQLRLAYHDRDGQSSERLTYVLKQLLDPAVRRAYDECVLGQIYIDKYVEAAMRRKAQAEAQRRLDEHRARGFVVNEGVEKETLQRVFKDMGVDVSFEDVQTGSDTPEDAVDGPSVTDNDDPADPAKEIPFSYSYYLWRCRVTGKHHIDALARWQELLVSAMSKRGVRRRFAVGLLGGMASPMALARVGYRDVFFLKHDEPPTAALAERAVSEWLAN